MEDRKSPRIVLAGGVSSSRHALAGLIRNGANVVGVLEFLPKNPDAVSDYHRLSDIADEAGIECIGFEKINDASIIDQVEQWQPDLLFVVGLSQLVHAKLLSVPTTGCVGYHPTHLPKGRGRAPIAWLTLDAVSGASSFFLMDEGADSGPMLAQEPFEVRDTDYASDVLDSSNAALGRALDRWIPDLVRGEWNPVAQDDSLATWHGKRGPDDGLIDWSKSAAEIHSLIRTASKPHPGAYSYHKRNPLTVWRAEVETQLPIRGTIGRVLINDDRGALIQTGDGLLWLTEVESESGTQLEDLKVGQKLGFVIEDELFQLRQRVGELEALIHETLQLRDAA